MKAPFDLFFGVAARDENAVAGARKPYPYQQVLAEREMGSLLLNVPTGLGKTAAVVLAWLYQLLQGKENCPRRFVYCLPMRALVEQTVEEIRNWLKHLSERKAELGLGSDDHATACLEWLAEHSPIVLMGGEDKEAMRDWDLYPEKPAILVGTQDMLISRTLNRGYGMSRYRWPMHYAYLNNDCLWCLDEVQLMDVTVETSAQLNAFRQKLGVMKNTYTWWMSATLDDERLKTVDHREQAVALQKSKLELSAEEKQLPAVVKRLTAPKPLKKAAVALNKDSEESYAKNLAQFILDEHKSESLTLVIVNRVKRAQEIFKELEKLLEKARKSGSKYGETKTALLHSRFREIDRKVQMDVLQDENIPDKIVVSTQVVEAGINCSARTMIIELAPWSSLVQRFGRCNRDGKYADATVHWVDVTDEDALPYSEDEFQKAREELNQLETVALDIIAGIKVKEKELIRPVIRKKDFVDLFDTTADICGNDLDVSRYIRGGDENKDAFVFWRDDTDGEGFPGSMKSCIRKELCWVKISRLREFLKEDKNKNQPVYAWDLLDEKWHVADSKDVNPGMTYLLRRSAGGYSKKYGWTKEAKDCLDKEDCEKDTDADADFSEKGYSSDNLGTKWISLKDHTADVLEKTEALCGQLNFSEKEKKLFEKIALWHDVGKAHDAFQTMLSPEESQAGTIWAKSPKSAPRSNHGSLRRYFRHELASALAWLELGGSMESDGSMNETDASLIAYIIAAHHGKVRLSIRSLPEEQGEGGKRVARGVQDGDTFRVEIDGGIIGNATMDLSLMELGESEKGKKSWLARMLALRDSADIGPLHLAYLEAVFRSADMFASREETKPANAES